MNIALVLAGGTGVRLGADIPKQYIEVNGSNILKKLINLWDLPVRGKTGSYQYIMDLWQLKEY